MRAHASRKKTAKSTAHDPEKCTTPRGDHSKRARTPKAGATGRSILVRSLFTTLIGVGPPDF